MTVTGMGRMGRTILLSLLGFLSVYFVGYMTLVRFDYGFAVQVMALLAAGHYIAWVPWCFKQLSSNGLRAKNGHVWFCVAMHVAIALFCPLEIMEDFPPLLGTFDGHGLWHAGGVLAAYWWGKFLVMDCIAEAADDADIPLTTVKSD